MASIDQLLETLANPEGRFKTLEGIHLESENGEPHYSLHCGGDMQLLGGSMTLATADDGAHSDHALIIGSTGSDYDAPYVNITKSYEGIEGVDITQNSGTVMVTSSDDGYNAAGGSDSSGNHNNGGWGQGGWGGPGEKEGKGYMRIRREAEAGPAQGLEGGFYRCRMLRYNKRHGGRYIWPLGQYDHHVLLLAFYRGRGIRHSLHYKGRLHPAA